MLPMDDCHLILGRPWQYDISVQHDGRDNTYSFHYAGRKITLAPSQESETNPTSGGVTLLTYHQFASALIESKAVYVLMCKEHKTNDEEINSICCAAIAYGIL